MPVSAATLTLLMEAGLKDAKLLAVVSSIEADYAPKKSSGAVRQARYRANHKASDVTGDVTNDVTSDAAPSPKEINSNPQPDNTGERAGARDHRAELASLRSAAGDSLSPIAPALEHVSELNRWLGGGADMALDILPAIRARAMTLKTHSVRSWAFFTGAIADARERRLQNLPPGNPNNGGRHERREPGKPTGVSAVARRLADEYRQAESQSGTVIELQAIGRG